MQNEATVLAQEIAACAQLPYAIHIEPDEADGVLCYVAYHPELPGCMAQGRTPLEAVVSLQEAREMCLAGLLRHNQPIPEPHFRVLEKVA